MRKQRSRILPGGCFAGQLTDLGISQTTELGRTLRTRYSLGAYDKDTVSVRSTNVPRCVASAQGVLDGMFPGLAASGVVVPIDTLSSDDDYLTPNGKACARMGELFNEGAMVWARRPDGDTPAVVRELEKTVPSPVLKALLYKFRDTPSFVPLRDVIVSMDAHNMPLPWGITSDIRDRLDRLGALEVEVIMKGGSWLHDLEASRVGLGRWLGELSDNLADKATKAKATKAEGLTVDLISAHDTTVMPILISLGIFDDPHWPNYASSISFELWTKGNGRFVRVLYNDEPQVLRGA